MNNDLHGVSHTVIKKNNLAHKIKAFSISLKNLGLRSSLAYLYYKILGDKLPLDGETYKLYSPEARYPVLCRRKSTDILVFGQIFAYREYRCLDEITNPKLIIDCGANIGCSSSYFLTRFPDAKVIAIEPDPDNFKILEMNLAPYKDRVQPLKAAIWSHSGKVALGEGETWSRKVKEISGNDDNDNTVPSVDIGTLLDESGHERISILKIDVEGAEKDIFSSNFHSWLSRTDNLVIELHGAECTSIVEKAMSEMGCFEASHCDELTVWKRVS
jgi:FkbM family methyltransferase